MRNNTGKKVLSGIFFVATAGFFYFYSFSPLGYFLHITQTEGYRKYKNFYLSSSVKAEDFKLLKEYEENAQIRVSNLFGSQISEPVFVVCGNEEEFACFASASVPASTQLTAIGTFSAINILNLDSDVLAHEICHQELFKRVGWFNRLMKIPTWFDEGMAMQVDYRDTYSEENFRKIVLPRYDTANIFELVTERKFMAGDENEVKAHYSIAKHIIAGWYKKEKLAALIAKLNSGKNFEEAYR